MNGYSKPIFNPNKTAVTPKKSNEVETVNNFKPIVDNIKSIEADDNVDIENKTNIIPSNDDELLEQVVQEAAKTAEENEDIEHIRDLQHKEYEDRDISELIPENAIKDKNLPDGVVAVEKTFSVDHSGKPIFVKDGEDPIPASDVDILHLDDIDDIDEKNFRDNFMKTAAVNHEISDDDAIVLLDIMTAYKKNKNMSVYNRMPDSIKNQVKQICMSANIPMSNANMVAKAMIDEMIAETQTDRTFIDFEKSIAQAMKIPNLIDIYEEHIQDTVSEKLPAMADAIRDEDPEKADMLMAIADRYNKSRDYSELKAMFDSTARIRKLIRRDYTKWKRFADELNFMNKDSKFRMTDATSLYPILIKLIANDPDCDIEEDGVQKFMVLLCSSCFNLDKHGIVDAAYIYYLLKNISMLGYVNEDSSREADAFSVELISNIKSMIYYILAKEDEFNASNKSSRTRKK